LPEPDGIIPNKEFVLIRPFATSLIVPSPPTPTIISNPFLAALELSSVA